MHIYLLKVRYTIFYMHGAVGSADSLKNLAGGLGPHRWKISGKQRMRARGQKSGGGSKWRRQRGWSSGRTRTEGSSWGPRLLRHCVSIEEELVVS